MPMFSSDIDVAVGAGVNGGRWWYQLLTTAEKLRILADTDLAASAVGVGVVLHRGVVYC